MVRSRRLPIRLNFWWATFLLAATAALAAEGGPAAATPPQTIPSRRATKYLIHHERPDYPSIAKLNFIQGKVRVLALVDDMGKVKEAHVVEGHPLLAVAALNSIQNWLFKPAHLRPAPASFLTFIDVNFSLLSRRVIHIPDRPESDLGRQVHPPRVTKMGNVENPAAQIRLRVLVGTDGEVVDSFPTKAIGQNLVYARQALLQWQFRPARWGAIPVPWYLEVDVPIGEQPPDVSGLALDEPQFDSFKAR